MTDQPTTAPARNVDRSAQRRRAQLREALAEALHQVFLTEVRKRSTTGGPAKGIGLGDLFQAAKSAGKGNAASFWTKAPFGRAIEDLEAQGRVRLEATEGDVIVHPVPPIIVPPVRRPAPPPRPPIAGPPALRG